MVEYYSSCQKMFCFHWMMHKLWFHSELHGPTIKLDDEGNLSQPKWVKRGDLLNLILTDLLAATPGKTFWDFGEFTPNRFLAGDLAGEWPGPSLELAPKRFLETGLEVGPLKGRSKRFSKPMSILRICLLTKLSFLYNFLANYCLKFKIKFNICA